MLEALKYYDGSVTEIDRIPDDLKARYLTSFEVEPKWIIECAAHRQKWIDMGQSLNLYLVRAFRQETTRDVYAGLGTRVEDDLLSANSGGDTG